MMECAAPMNRIREAKGGRARLCGDEVRNKGK